MFPTTNRHGRRSSSSLRATYRPRLEALEDRTVPSAYVVTTTADSGLGSLRDAITQINADTTNQYLGSHGVDEIGFNIDANNANNGFDPAHPMSQGHFYYQDLGGHDQPNGRVNNGVVTPTSAANDQSNPNLDQAWPNSWWRISPQTPLPFIEHQVYIDGYSQPGASQNNNGAGLGDDAVPCIELDGSVYGLGNAESLLLRLGASQGTVGTGSDYSHGSTVRGLVIHGFEDGISVASGQHDDTIQGNFLGTDPSGTLPLGNGVGIFVINPTSHMLIGTDGSSDLVADKGDRNLISANNGGGINMVDTDHSVIAGNFIGVDRTGVYDLGNYGPAITIRGAISPGNANCNRIGTDGNGVADDLERNIISGSRNYGSVHAYGVIITNINPHGNVVAGNFIGTDVTGMQAIGNGSDGVVLANGAYDNRIGIDPNDVDYQAERNVISGNTAAGLGIALGSHNNVVAGNYIGTQYYGTSPLGNNGVGLAIGEGSTNNQVGGAQDDSATAAALLGNTIAYNTGIGVFLPSQSISGGNTTTDASSNGNAIRGNAIYANGELGIDLGGTFNFNNFTSAGDGVTDNNAAGHVGPNNYQNYPVQLAAQAGSSVLVSGSLQSAASTQYLVDVYASPSADPSGHGQGQYYLGTAPVQTDSSGNVNFVADFSAANVPGGAVPAGWTISATATDPGGNTSEFSADATAAPAQTFSQFLQAALLTSPVLTIPADPSNAAAVVNALNALGDQSSNPVTVSLNLAPATYGGLTVNVPNGMTLLIGTASYTGGQQATIDPDLPSFTLLSGNVVISNVTFLTTGAAPTILVTGGSLTLRDDTIQESSQFTDAAISVSGGGTVNLGTATDPGNNLIEVTGSGEFVHNRTTHLVPASGDTFTVNGAPLAAPLLSFTALMSSVASSPFGQPVTFTAQVTPDATASAAPSGSVDFFDTTTNTDLGTAPLSGGQAVLTNSVLALGNDVVVATYSGDGNYLPGLDTVTHTVLQVTPTVSVSDAGGTYNGLAFAATATVTGVSGTPGSSLEGTGLTVTYYPGSYTSVSQLTGLMGSTAAPSTPGSYTVLAAFAGSGDYTAQAALTTFTITAVGVTVEGDVYVLNQTASGALTLTGNATLDVAGVLQVDSSSAAAVHLSGSADVNAASTLIVGGDQVSGNAHFNHPPVTHAVDAANPLAALTAPTGGTPQTAVNLCTGTLTINPGVYSSITVSGNAHLILTPGVYSVGSGGITISGNATVSNTTAAGGQGILIYNTGALTVSGNASVNLTAFSTGLYAGLAIFQAQNDANAVTVSGNANVNLNGGLLYAANAQCVVTISGNAVLGASLVVNELTIFGNADETAP